MSLGVGKLSEVLSGATLGTVFAVTRQFALTAFHCVGDRNSGRIDRLRLKCAWGSRDSYASVVEFDQLNDIALLRMEETLPVEIQPIRLVSDVLEHDPFVAPGAPYQVPEVPIYAASGEVSWRHTLLPDGASAIQLICWDSAAGLSLQGLSGAPVLVGQPLKAAGVVRWNSPRQDNPSLANGASIFATPSSEILLRWPYLNTRHEELEVLFRRLADRIRSRSAADIQSDVGQVLLLSELGISEKDLGARSETGYEHCRFDIEEGAIVIEPRANISRRGDTSSVGSDLERYIVDRAQSSGRRYIAVLTDGAEWRVYHRVDDRLRCVEAATLRLDSSGPEVSELLLWLEALLATGRSIRPTPVEIVRKLGATSPSYALDFAELSEIYDRCRELPAVKIKRAMWAKLLTTASGANFADDDSLFVDHTLLVAMAEVIGHVVVGFSPEDPHISATTIMSGVLFSNAQIGGVVEADFFDWVAQVPGGERFVKELARRLARFSWWQVEHDVMKMLYESIIPQEVRHQLGEYYTPDWLAEYLIAECVAKPLRQRVLDASCGSGTFLFHAVRAYVTAAEASGMRSSDIVRSVGRHVVGFDVHPVAVTLARVTYLLGIGMHLLQADDRPAFNVPVYLGDSIRWGQEDTLWSDDDLKVSTLLDHDSFVNDPDFSSKSNETEQLRFPDSIVADAGRFDRLVSILADRATGRQRGRGVPSLNATFDRLGILDNGDRSILQKTFATMCRLHDDERNHIWGYYVRNLARPAWLARPENRVDVLVGNPPWLAYRYMTEAQKSSFRAMNTERQLWAGRALATNQDLSALFVVRCIELYLKAGGKFGYVMPLAAQSRRQYAGFRAGSYPIPAETLSVAFDSAWDLHRIKPAFFPQSVGVVLGRRLSNGVTAVPLSDVAEMWSGRFDTRRASRMEATASISRTAGESRTSSKGSPYGSRFFQGATIVPRFLFFVEQRGGSPLGAGAGRRAVESRRSAFEKQPWKSLSPLNGTVEEEFLMPVYVGDSIMPFRCLEPLQAAVPWDGRRLLHGDDERIDSYPGLAQWWRSAEAMWNRNRSSERLELIQRLDYPRGFSHQFPASKHRIVYTKSGMYLAAAIVSDTTAVIDHKLYWGAASDFDEALYLTAILNSGALTMAVRPMQARGEHNPRDFDKYVFGVPIPPYDPQDLAHRELVELARRSAHVAASVELPPMRFEAQRRLIRSVLAENGVAAEVDALVKTLIA